MSDRKPTAISLFSGIGGLDAGLQAAGFEIRACVERDAIARKSIRTLHPKWSLVEQGDACLVSGDELLEAAGLQRGDVTLLAGGPPCQPFSRARAWAGPPPGQADPRAQTLAAFFRLAADVAPQVLVLENVPGLVTAAEAYLRRKIRELSRKVGARYSAAFHDVQAADYGVPQKRRRLLLVCVRDGEELTLPSPSHAPIADPSRGLERYRTAWDANWPSRPASLANRTRLLWTMGTDSAFDSRRQ